MRSQNHNHLRISSDEYPLQRDPALRNDAMKQVYSPNSSQKLRQSPSKAMIRFTQCEQPSRSNIEDDDRYWPQTGASISPQGNQIIDPVDSNEFNQANSLEGKQYMYSSLITNPEAARNQVFSTTHLRQNDLSQIDDQPRG